ncbi:hypothetical protein Bca52824_028160 [Brassica carinata]|uniref:Ubiquitin-like protease family profile domain-containing protein n=1 Tax=Brassica carinata TaxID=52824 RepID=A0A8X8AR94_BRACI|nr:hypothetical protein Bca52824_028160 [Brassica carinata]
MVEAIRSLTEVVQESCSDSEGGSDEEVDVMSDKPKRKTLSPGHARNVDKQSDSALDWSDEEDDQEVNNLVYLINTNFEFNKSMFVGGVTKLDVERMREFQNVASKAKKSKKLSVLSLSNDPGYFASLVIEKIKPEFQTMEGNIMEACKRVDSIEGSLVEVVQSVFATLKEEMLESVRNLVTALSKDEDAGPSRIPGNVTNTVGRENYSSRVNGAPSNGCPVREGNDQIIRNILDNLCSYSTPPDSPRGDPTPTEKREGLYGEALGDNVNQSLALSAHSHNHHTPELIKQPLEGDNRVLGPVMDMPSFSLGLTQEEAMNGNHEITVTESVRLSLQPTANHVADVEDQQQCRRSKRQKCVPHALFQDYECGPDIVSRVKKSQKLIFSFHDRTEIDRKYARLLQKIHQHFIYKVCGLSISGKDILLIADRSRILTSKVVDMLIQLVQFRIQQQLSADREHSLVFLDNTYVAAITRTYQKFCKTRKKESYSFPKGVVQFFRITDVANLSHARYYFPLTVGKKHWVGICVDIHSAKITVLDCNTFLFTDAMMEKQVKPHLVMLPYILRQSMQVCGSEKPQRVAFDRPKDLCQTENASDAGLMAVLFMSTHALYGLETCKIISTDVLVDEGGSAAVMVFECKDMV